MTELEKSLLDTIALLKEKLGALEIELALARAGQYNHHVYTPIYPAYPSPYRWNEVTCTFSDSKE